MIARYSSHVTLSKFRNLRAFGLGALISDTVGLTTHHLYASSGAVSRLPSVVGARRIGVGAKISCADEKRKTEGHRGIAVVTGASRGIGAAVAVSLGQEGYAIAVNFKGSEIAAEEVVCKVRSAGGVAEKFKANMAIENEVVELFDSVERCWPDLELSALVNSAGVLIPNEKLDSANSEAFRFVFDINVLGPLVASREFVRRFACRRGRGGGGIVNISSGSASLGNGIYGMSKAALNGLQAWLVTETAPLGIRVNTVSPGATRTDMITCIPQDKSFVDSVPMGRLGEPHEIADAVVFLLSEKASFIHGANIRVAGGRSPGTFIG